MSNFSHPTGHLTGHQQADPGNSSQTWDAPLFQASWSPVYQDLSVASFAAAGLPAPSNAWLGNGTDVVGSENLTLTTAIADQPARGLWDGSSIEGYGAIEFTGAGGKAAASGNSFFDPDLTTAFAILAVVRECGEVAGNASIARKRAVGGGQGWMLYQFGSTLYFTLDGTTGSAVVTAGSGVLRDGGYHFVLAGHDVSAGVGRIYTDVVDQSASSASLTGTLSAADPFLLGSNNGTTKSGMQIVAAYAFTGTAAQTLLTNRALLRSAWWKHGTDSSGALTTYTRTGSQYTIGPDSSSGETLLPWGTGSAAHVAVGYDRYGTGGYGLQRGISHTNLLTYSEPGDAAWDRNSGTATTLDKTNPLGYKRAVKYTSAGTSHRLSLTFAGSNTVRYVASAYVYWDGTGTAPAVAIENAARTTVVSAAATEVNKWHRISCGYTAVATEAHYCALWPNSVGGSGGYAWFDHAQVETVAAGPQTTPNSFVATAGATATSAAVAATGDLPAEIPQNDFRCALIRSHPYPSVSYEYLFRLARLSGSSSSVLLTYNPSDRAETFFYNDAGGTIVSISTSGASGDTREASTVVVQSSTAPAQRVTASEQATPGSATASTISTKYNRWGVGSEATNSESLVHSVKIYKRSKL